MWVEKDENEVTPRQSVNSFVFHLLQVESVKHGKTCRRKVKNFVFKMVSVKETVKESKEIDK